MQLVQAAFSVEREQTLERETSALREAMERFGVTESTIVTLDEERTEAYPEGVVHVVPAWKWLLDV